MAYSAITGRIVHLDAGVSNVGMNAGSRCKPDGRTAQAGERSTGTYLRKPVIPPPARKNAGHTARLPASRNSNAASSSASAVLSGVNILQMWRLP